MIEITLTKSLNGKQLVEEMEKEYGDIDKLKRVFERGQGNMKLQLDLEDWEYFINHPDEKFERSKTIFTNSLNLNSIEIELLDLIKNTKPNSISEIAKLTNKDNTTIQRKINKLAEEGLVKFKRGLKNSKIPIITYDKIEIAL